MRCLHHGEEVDVRNTVVALGVVLLLSGCGSDVGGPGAQPQSFYDLSLVDSGSLPFLTWQNFGVREFMVSARLSPLSAGRTTDERLVTDRTSSGTGSGNARDTTVARGQMMDVRFFESSPTVGRTYDSTVVDVVRKDTVFLVTRPHPDPARTVVDTGYFVGNLLVIPTLLTRAPNTSQWRRVLLIYRVSQ